MRSFVSESNVAYGDWDRHQDQYVRYNIGEEEEDPEHIYKLSMAYVQDKLLVLEEQANFPEFSFHICDSTDIERTREMIGSYYLGEIQGDADSGGKSITPTQSLFSAEEYVMVAGLGHSESISFRHIIEREKDAEIYSRDNSYWESILAKPSDADQIPIVKGEEEKVDYDDGYREEDNSHSSSGDLGSNGRGEGRGCTFCYNNPGINHIVSYAGKMKNSFPNIFSLANSEDEVKYIVYLIYIYIYINIDKSSKYYSPINFG